MKVRVLFFVAGLLSVPFCSSAEGSEKQVSTLECLPNGGYLEDQGQYTEIKCDGGSCGHVPSSFSITDATETEELKYVFEKKDIQGRPYRMEISRLDGTFKFSITFSSVARMGFHGKCAPKEVQRAF